MKFLTLIQIISIIFILNISGIASFEKKEAGALEQALGNAVVALPGATFALYYNPANIISNNRLNVFTNYRNFFNLPGVYQADIISVFDVVDHPTSVAVSKYGNDLYSEVQLSMGTPINITPEFAVGISFQIYSLSISNYGESISWGLNIGCRYAVVDRISLGAHITNINRPSIGKVKEELPQTFSLGMKYQIFEKAVFLFEFYRDVQHEQDYRSGFQYELYDNTFIRAGISNNTNTYSFGTGSRISIFVFDYSLMVHEILGESHSLTVGITL